jgi:integrase
LAAGAEWWALEDLNLRPLQRQGWPCVSKPAGSDLRRLVRAFFASPVILAAVRGTDPWDVAVALALGVTLRREEVLALRWSDVDLDAGRLTVERTLTYADGTLHVGDP